MAKKTEMGAVLRLEGEQQFKQTIKNVNASLKELDSELKLVSAEFGNNAKSQEALAKKQEILNKKIEEQNNKIGAIEGNLGKVQERYKKSADAIEKYKKELEQAKSSENASAEEIAKIESKLQNAQKAYEKNGNAIKNYETQINNAKAELINFENELQQVENDLKSGSGFDKAKQQLDGLSGKLKETGERITSLGSAMTLGVTTPILAGVGASVKSGMGFESALSQVQATMNLDKTSDDMQRIKETSEQLGESTQFSASQAAEAFNYLALAGQNADQAIASIPHTLDLALAGNMDLASATDLVTDAQSALGISVEETEQFVDKLARTSQKSNTNIAQLGEGILTVGGTAKNLKGGVTELATELGILADNGIKGAEGGTVLRNAILSLTAGTDKAKAQIEAIGLQVFDSTGSMRGMNEILTDLNGILASMTDEERVNVLNTIFNKNDLKGVEALLANSTDRFNELSQAIDNSNGAAKQMAETMSDNLEGKMKSLQSKLESLQNEVFEILLPRLNELADAVMKVVDWFKSLDEETKKQVIDIGLFVAAIGPALVVVGQFVQAISLIATSVSGAVTALAGLSAIAPFTPLIVAGGALVAVLFETVNAVNDVIQKTEEAKNTISSASQKIIDDVENSTKAYDEQRKSINELNKAYDEEMEQINSSAEKSELLIKKLEELEKQTDLTEEQQKELKTTVNQLNQLYPDLNLSVDSNTGALSKNTTEIRNNIKALQDQAKQQAYNNKLTGLEQQKLDAQLSYKSSKEQADKLKKQYDERKKQDDYDRQLIADYNAGTIRIDEETGEKEYKYTKEQYEAALKRLASSEKETAELKKAYDQSIANTTNYAKQIGKAGGEIYRVNKLMGSSQTQAPMQTGNTEKPVYWNTYKTQSENWIKQRNNLDDWSAFGTTEVESVERMINTLNEYYKEGRINYEDYIKEKSKLDTKLSAAQKKVNDAQSKEQKNQQKEQDKANKEALKEQEKADKEAEKKRQEAEKKRQEDLAHDWYYQKDISLKWIAKRNELGDWEAQNTNEADSYQRMLKKLQELYKQGYVDYDVYLKEKAELTEKYDDVKTDPDALKKEYREKQNYSKKWIGYRNLYGDYDEYGTTEGESVGRMIDRAGEYYDQGVLDYEEYVKEIEGMTSDMVDKQQDFYDSIFSHLKEQYSKGLLNYDDYLNGINEITALAYKAQQKIDKDTKEQQIKAVESEWDKRLKSAKDRIDKVKSDFDKQISSLQNQFANEDRARDLNELYEEADKYRRSVTASGQEHYEDIQKQIEQIEREQQIADLQEEQNRIIEEMEEEYKAMEEQKSSILEDMKSDTGIFQNKILNVGLNMLSAITTVADNIKNLNGKGTVNNYINTDNSTYNTSNTNTFNNTINDNVDADIFNRTHNLDKLNY